MKLSRPARLAVVLWVVWAVVVWNVVFDRILVLAGRRYVYEAALAAEHQGRFLRVDDWMRPAIAHGLWTASAASLGLLAVGLALITLGVRTNAGRRLQEEADRDASAPPVVEPRQDVPASGILQG